MQVLYYDCFSGISGDMHLGAMVDLGIDPDVLTGQLELLGVKGYEIRISKDQRKEISGTRVDVVLEDHQNNDHDHDHHHHHHHHHHHQHHHGHRNLKDITDIIEASGLSKEVKERSLAMFKKLAEAEARVHGKSIDEIHFHEVGAIDSIVDIVGAAICIEELKPDRIISSPIELGGGFVKCAHGTFPVPAPATAEILTGIPVRSGAVQKEATTPTGAVIIACNVDEFSPLDGFRIIKTAYGIGQRDHDIPNVLRLYLGEMDVSAQPGLIAQEATLVECNIDDMNPELYGYVMEQLFDAGADDVFITPIIMKKARPANKLSALCHPDKENEVVLAMLSHTTSLGLRTYRVNKVLLEREFTKIQTSFGEVTLKTAIYQGIRLKSKPEYEDCVRLAREHKVPVQEIYDEIAHLDKQTK